MGVNRYTITKLGEVQVHQPNRVLAVENEQKSPE